MDHSTAQRITCSHCGEEFGSKGKYDYHYRKAHQLQNKRDDPDNTKGQSLRGEDGKFHCACGKKYMLYDSLWRHHKNCGQWKDQQAIRECSIESNDSEQGISLNGLTNIKMIMLLLKGSLLKDHCLCHW